MQPLKNFMLATFLTHAHHEATTPDAIRIITAQLEGKEWSATIIKEVRTKVQAAFQNICEDSDSQQVRLNAPTDRILEASASL
jgi:hypothetical protein